MKKEIYFAGSIRGGRDFSNLYLKSATIIQYTIKGRFMSR